MADTILARLQKYKTISMMFPDDPMCWVGTKTAFNFSVGSMFWARTDALKPLFDLNLDWDNYREEPANIDSSILYIIKRLLPFITPKAGYKTVLTHVKEISP